MKKLIFYIITFFYFTITLFLIGSLSSCSQDSPKSPDPINEPKQSTVLIYAVATNSLTGNLVSDKNEILEAAVKIDLNKNNVLIFETQYKYLEDNTRVGDVNLLKLVKEENQFSWECVKDFNDGIASLDPIRISEIISYVSDYYPAENYGLVFWSHSTASQPYFETASKVLSSYSNEPSKVDLPMQYAFGQDIPVGSGNPFYQINIDDLAEAIPDNFFDYIWFDSCYMSNIETIYQFRNKCKTFVGYPTEVLDSGLPYQYVLPYMVGSDYDLTKAADAFYQYYSYSFGTIAVIDMNKIESIADFCRNVYQEGTEIKTSSLVRYSRNSTGPFYDFGDYTRAMAVANSGEGITEEFEKVLNEAILYKATTDGTLLGLSINKNSFSGISTHVYKFGEDDQKEQFYKSLDWFQSVF